MQDLNTYFKPSHPSAFALQNGEVEDSDDDED